MDPADDIKSPWDSLVTFEDLPHWRQDNKHITGGYRKTSNSYAKSFLSMVCHLHNETVNIWSHLFPALASLPLAYFLHLVLLPRYERATRADVLAFSCFFLGAASCLGMSATYHTISNHSPRVNMIGNQLDYVGIVLMINGSFVPSIYYGFWCDTHLQMLYWFMICSLGVACTSVTVLGTFRTPAWRSYRAAIYVALGLSAVFPILHGLSKYGVERMRLQIGLFWLVLQGVLYILGAGIYANRIPEKWHPGKYDIFGNSHQIFHFLVVAAACSHLLGLIEAFDYRHGVPGATCAEKL